MIQVSVLNRKEIKACSDYIDALDHLSRIKGKSWENVTKRLLMLRILTEDELWNLCNQLERISKEGDSND